MSGKNLILVENLMVTKTLPKIAPNNGRDNLVPTSDCYFVFFT